MINTEKWNYTNYQIQPWSLVVVLLLVWPAVEFLRLEYEVGKTLIWKIPLWASQAVMPLMLTVIGARFFAAARGRLLDRNAS